MDWQRLGHAELSSGASTIDTGTFEASTYLQVIIHTVGGASCKQTVQFNGDSSGSAGSSGKYFYRASYNGGSYSDSVNQIRMMVQGNSTSNDAFGKININNISGREKVCFSQACEVASGASNAPQRSIIFSKWTETTGQITSIQVKSDTGNNFGTGSYITVFGVTGDTVTDEKTTLTNVPANTRYEEYNTRKIFRAKQVGFASGSSGSGSDWTEVAFDSSTAVNNATASGNVVSRSSGSGWDSYIRSSVHYLDPSEGGGEVYFTVSSSSTSSVGLEKSPYNQYPSAVYTSRDYSFHTTTATNNMYEKTSDYDGTDWNNATNEWRITMDSAGLVKYYYRVNSSGSWNLERTSTVTASGKYYVSVSPPNTSTNSTCFIKSSSAIAWKERGSA